MCLLYISIHNGDCEAGAHMFTAVVSTSSQERGGDTDAGHTDYVIQHGLAYFCREGMFVLLMIKFPSPQITVEQIRACLERLKAVGSP